MTDKALLAEVSRFPRSSYLSSLGILDSECWPLKVILQDASLEGTFIRAKVISGKDRAGAEKLKTPIMSQEFILLRDEKALDSLPSKFVNFSKFLGMPVEGFEKEIYSLLKKPEARKGWK